MRLSSQKGIGVLLLAGDRYPGVIYEIECSELEAGSCWQGLLVCDRIDRLLEAVAEEDVTLELEDGRRVPIRFTKVALHGASFECQKPVFNA